MSGVVDERIDGERCEALRQRPNTPHLTPIFRIAEPGGAARSSVRSAMFTVTTTPEARPCSAGARRAQGAANTPSLHHSSTPLLRGCGTPFVSVLTLVWLVSSVSGRGILR